MGGTHTQAASVMKLTLSFLAALLVLGAVFSVASPAFAAVTIASGTTKDEDGNAIAGAQIDCLTGENNQGATSIATSDASGNFICSVDTSSIANGTPISIQPRQTEGYRSPQQENFTWEGTPRTINFQYQSAAKTINVTVKYEDGQNVPAVQVTAQPINLAQGQNASQVQEDFQGGSGDLSVSGGEWIVKADANFSETNAESYPWISITQPQRIVFNDDNAEESEDLEFIVARSDTKVNLTLLDADGAKLNEGFVGDAYFEGFSGTYGALSTSRKVNPTTGVSSLYLLPGVWRVKALDTQFDNESFSIEDATFVVPDEAGTYEMGEIQATENLGSVSGTFLVGSSGTQNVQVVATNIDTGDRRMGTTTSNGAFVINGLSNGNYSITVSQDGYIATQSGSALLSDESNSATGVEVVAQSADTTVEGNVVDENGNKLENVPGTVVVKGDGVEFSAPVNPDGSFELNMYTSGLPDDEMQLQFVPQAGAEVFAPDPVTVPVEPNSTFNADLETSTDEATITGNLTTFGGDELGSTDFGKKPKMMAMNAETGAVEMVDVDANGAFEMNVGPGEWNLVPQINDPNATVLPANTSSIMVTVEAGESATADVPMHQQAGDVELTISDPDGNPVPEAPVLFTNLPALQQEAATNGELVDQNKIVQVAATANADGVVNTLLPEGEFTAYFGTNPDVNQFAEPESDTFTILEDSTVQAEVAYKEAGSTVSGSIGSDFKSGSVTFFAPNGGTETFPVNENGEYSGALAEGDWKAIASGVKEGEVYLVEDTLTIGDGDNTFEPTLEATGVDFPAAVTKSGQASQPIIVSNTDGASVSMPAYSAGFEGTMTVTLQPMISFGNNGDLGQVGLSYEVSVVDDSGTPVNTLNSPATVTLPLPEAFAGTVDKTEMTGAYFNPNLQSFLSDGVVATSNGTEMVMQTKHFSRFAVTTSLTEVEEDAAPGVPTELATKKLKKHSVVADWDASTGTVTKYVLQVRKKGVAKKAKWMKYNNIQKTQRKVTGLKTGTTYQFRVKACNGDLCSDYSNWKKFTTKGKAE